MTASFSLFISYSQIAVFDSALEHPFNLWTEGHVKQGFSWRAGSVSFATIEETGQYSVEIEIASDNAALSSNAIRIIQTPFEVPASGSIEIASISDSIPYSLPSGMYALLFECFPISNDSQGKVRFVFTKQANPSFKIMRADTAITAGNHLLLSASPA
jgi:hypothetical protein